MRFFAWGWYWELQLIWIVCGIRSAWKAKEKQEVVHSTFLSPSSRLFYCMLDIRIIHIKLHMWLLLVLSHNVIIKTLSQRRVSIVCMIKKIFVLLYTCILGCMVMMMVVLLGFVVHGSDFAFSNAPGILTCRPAEGTLKGMGMGSNHSIAWKWQCITPKGVWLLELWWIKVHW